MTLGDWLAAGDAPEADWTPHLLKLANHGDLGSATAKLLLDLPALEQPYGCQSGECTPGMRAPKTRSCCADLQVSVTADEQARIEAALPEITAEMAHDPRWPTAALFEDGAMTRPGGRCVFAGEHTTGLRCHLHTLEDRTGRARGDLKPIPCRLFPLAVVDLGDGRQLLTAIHKSTARPLSAPAARFFPCLRDATRRPMWEDMRETIVSLFGKRAWTGLTAAMRDRAENRPRGHRV